MSELAKLRSQQQRSRGQIAAMEERLSSTERKQQQMMNFLARALNNPSFIQNLTRRGEVKAVDMRRKRRLTASPSTENLQEVATLLAQEDPVDVIESQMEAIFGSSSSDAGDQGSSLGGPSNSDTVNETTIWEELISEDLLKEEVPEEEDVLSAVEEPEFDINVEDLVADDSINWSENLNVKDLVDQMRFLESSP